LSGSSLTSFASGTAPRKTWREKADGSAFASPSVNRSLRSRMLNTGMALSDAGSEYYRSVAAIQYLNEL